MAWLLFSSSLRRVALSSIVLLAAGCPGDDATVEPMTTTADSTGTGTGPTSTSDATGTTASPEPTTSTTAEPTAGQDSTTGPAFCEPLPAATTDCCCFATVETGAGIDVVNGCPTNPLCDSLQIECPDGADCPSFKGGGGKGELTVSDEAALECILTALRDGTEGSITWSYTGTLEPGFASHAQTLHILPDRGALSSVLVLFDLSGEWSDVTETTLLPAAGFDACLQATDLPARLACLNPPTTNEVLAVCTEGGTFSKF